MRRPYGELLDANGSLQRGHARLVVIVESARADNVEVLRRGAPTRLNIAHIYLGTRSVFRVRIRIHVVRPAVVVHKRDARAW